MTESSIKVLSILRKTDNLQWYVVPLLIFVIYVYVVEIEKKNWSAVLLGICACASEFMWEMFNALILHFTNYAPLWTTPTNSAYVIYAGFNIEIAVLFATAAILLIKSLPEDKNKKIMSIPNRIFIPVIWGIICVIVETVLYKAGILVWDYWWWRWPHIYLITLVYIAPWLLIAWAHDNLTTKVKIIGAILLPLVALICHVTLVVILKWI